MSKGDVTGVTCYFYFKGIDGLGTCNTGCQWWAKNGNKEPLKHVCPYWIKPENFDTHLVLPKDEKGMFDITLNEYEEKYNTKIIVEGIVLKEA